MKLSFILQRRWLGYLAAAIVFAIACVLLSNWQHARADEAARENATIDRNFNATPVPLTDALPYDSAKEWKRVTVTGTYDAAGQHLARNRATDQGPGLEVLTPLRLSDGRIFIVDRGWLPSPSQGVVPKDVPEPPAGEVSVVVRLKGSEPTLPGQSAAGNTVGTINLPQLAGELGGDVVTDAYGLLQTADPGLTPVVSTPPYADTGMHWSYMIQWLIFAAIGFFGLGYAIRTEYRRLHEPDEPEPRRARRRPTDAEAEDALLDAR